MTTIDMLTQRNHDFAAQRFTPGLPLMPTLGTMIISCADPRVDPAHVLGLEPGEAVVLRNIGGRITPATLQMTGMLRTVAQVEGLAPGGMHLILLHHTDCGITRLTANPAILAGYFGVESDDLSAKAVTDPWAAVAVDVAAVQANPSLPSAWLVSGLVYDVATGRVAVVVPPTPIRTIGGNG